MAIHIYFNPLDTACKNKIGAVKQGDNVEFNVFNLKYDYSKKNLIEQEDCSEPWQRAYMRIKKDGEEVQSFPMQKTAFGWHISFCINEIGLYSYIFQIEGEGFVSCNDMETGCLTHEENGFLLTVFSENYKTPEWFKGGVMYQIFPERFYKMGTMPDIKGRIQREDWGGLPSYRPNEQGKVLNNDFFGGNLKGIEEKLPYLKELGVTVIYLNPIFEASSNHRYDTSDYMKIDPFLGTDKDLTSLVEAAKKQGIRLILDGVFNHTGDDSVYFNKYGHYSSIGAYQSKDSPYYSWYNFQEFPNKYGSWWGIDVLPEINEKSESYQNFIFGKDGVLKHWLRYGIGGYRLDVADELPDFFLKMLRESVKKENPEAIIIGEVWEDASNKIAYSQRREYLQGYELDSVMNYPLKDGLIYYLQTGNAKELLHIVRVLINHYPKQTLDCLMNILGTHDTARILTVLGGIYCKNKDEMASPQAYMNVEQKEKAVKKLKMGAVLQYTLPGVPCVYYGDENGMEGHIDPFCRRCFNWEHLNEELIGFYKKLGALRKKHTNIFKDGIFENICTSDGLFFFKRKNKFGKIYIYANNCSKKFAFELNGKFKDVLNNSRFENILEISENSFGIFIKE